jgi:hypothetical protein
MDDHYEYIYYSRKSWHKNGWRYNTKKRILYILGDIDSS